MPASAAEIVKAARDEHKITGPEILTQLFSYFIEFHGDRNGHDDPAIIGGIADYHGQAVTVIATDRGQTIEERKERHFGCPEPSGYRKALRLIKQANKFGRPVLCFVDTPGAYPGQSAEENGQGAAIAQNLLQISKLTVPIITVIFGEGGSGGALALACGDEVWMLENSTYSILSPEGFATILWKDASRAAEAAEVMQLTPRALLKQGVVDGIIPEPRNHQAVIANMDMVLKQELAKLQKLSPNELLVRRKERFRKF